MRPFPLRVHIASVFLALVLAIGGLIGWLGYQSSREQLESSADAITGRITSQLLLELELAVKPAARAVGLIRHHPIARASSHDERMQALSPLVEALESTPLLSSLYVGYGDGDFFFIRILRNPGAQASFDAPPGARYLVQSIDRPTGRYVYLGPALDVLRTDDRPDYAPGFDPRVRAWYQRASAADGQILTDPYVFHSDRQVGATIAVRSPDADVVVGADFLLASLGESLGAMKPLPGAQLAIIDEEGRLVAHERMAALLAPAASASVSAATATATAGVAALPALSALDLPAFSQLSLPPPRELRLESVLDPDGQRWRMSTAPLDLENDGTLHLLIALPEHELFADAIRLRNAASLSTLIVMALAIPVTLLIARGIAGSLQQLAGEAEAIRGLRFGGSATLHTSIREVAELAQTVEQMKRSIRRFLDINLAIASERHFDALLPKLLDETMSAVDAAAGVLYLPDDNGDLAAACARLADGTPMTPPPGTLATGVLDAIGNAPLLRSGHASETRLDDTRLAELGLASLGKATSARHALLVPLLNRERDRVGLMLLLRSEACDEARLSFVEALSGSTAVSLEARGLINAQRELFEAFTRLIAAAIDAKSPHTGEHCARVPELTRMLADAACRQTDGAYAGFRLDAQQWEAVRLAAWLHDCGKVTTPEFVVEKATKLEAPYNRIHEIRMRFELLKRDAQIDCLEAIARGEPAQQANAACRLRLATLDEDFAFVARCNLGGESMDDADIERLLCIGETRWLRTLDDRLGLSRDELDRMPSPAPTLPTAEPLLADRPEHRIARPLMPKFPDALRERFNMRIPQWLYDRGELHNLSTRRGTLTEEERYRINEHIVQTQIMLAQLPFPPHLRSVPEIAGNHHERVDGAGYPRGLHAEEMSPLSRMMAIADVFEALTAADRPYKPGMKLSQALTLMARMRDQGHLDPDLFDIFLRSGVHLEYARRFVAPGQIDEVDPAQFLQVRTESTSAPSSH